MNMGKITIREMLEKESSKVFELVKAGFDEFVKPDLTEEGTSEFFRAAQNFIFDKPNNHFIFVANFENAIIGMIDVRDNNHICLFFVDKKFQKEGVGRKLLEQALSKCISQAPEIRSIDINSSTFAVNAYERLGFVQTQEEQLANGIRFVPMVKTIRE
jgi:GNAT superfamily N-acetyltransferase